MTPEIKQRIEQMRCGEQPEGYKKTKAGILPADWDVYMLGDCLRRVEKPVEIKPNELYTQIGIRSHGKGLFYKEPVTGAALGNKSVFWIEPDCFIVNIVFAWEQAIGKTTQSEVGMIGSHRFPMYRPVNDRVDVDYLISYFLTKQGTDILESASPGGAGRNKTLGQDRFLKSKIVLPPIEEQQKIAAILTTQDKVIELKEKRLAEKQRQKKYLMQQLLTGKKRLPGFSGEWTDEELSNFCEFVGGGTPDTHNQLFWNGSIPWISSADLVMDDFKSIAITRFITQQAVKFTGAKLCPKGCILLVSRVGVGKIAIAPTDLCTSQDFTNIIQHKHNSLFLLYALYYLMRKNVKQTQGSAIKGITVKEIKNFSLKFPTILEQTAIAEVLTAADREIDLLRQEIEQEKQKKKALMQLLLTGIVRVNDDK